MIIFLSVFGLLIVCWDLLFCHLLCLVHLQGSYLPLPFIWPFHACYNLQLLICQCFNLKGQSVNDTLIKLMRSWVEDKLFFRLSCCIDFWDVCWNFFFFFCVISHVMQPNSPLISINKINHGTQSSVCICSGVSDALIEVLWLLIDCVWVSVHEYRFSGQRFVFSFCFVCP